MTQQQFITWLSSVCRHIHRTFPILVCSVIVSLFSAMKLLLSGFIMLQMLGFVSGYPTGAPTGACEDMLPRHSGVQAQTSPPPYTLLTNSKTFEPGKPITGMSLLTAATTVLLLLLLLEMMQMCYIQNIEHYMFLFDQYKANL